MKHLILFTMILGSFQLSLAQLSFKIDEIKLSNYNFKHNPNNINEELEKGPAIVIKCSIYNSSNDTVLLHPTNSEIHIQFNFLNKTYSNKAISIGFMENRYLKILPMNFIDFEIFEYVYYYDNSIFFEQKYKAEEKLLMIVPTLKVIYKEKNIQLLTSEIGKVTLLHP